jgi:hypothetical protein
MAMFYREEQSRGMFSKYVFFEESLKESDFEEKFALNQAYFDPNLKMSNQEFLATKSEKLKADFLSSLQHLAESKESFSKQIGMFLLDDNFTNTTYICEDSSSINLVSIIIFFQQS